MDIFGSCQGSVAGLSLPIAGRLDGFSKIWRKARGGQRDIRVAHRLSAQAYISEEGGAAANKKPSNGTGTPSCLSLDNRCRVKQASDWAA